MNDSTTSNHYSFYVRQLARFLHDSSTIWNEFEETIKHKNRFFPQSPNIERALEQLVKCSTIIKSDMHFYRARNMRMFPYDGFNYDGNRIWGYDQRNMAKPPKNIATAGRANPQNIPYLYLASNPQTACAEIRAELNDLISVMEFCTIREIKVIDLIKFDWEKKDAFSLFFWKISEAFTKHCSIQNDTFYAPTQYIASFLASQPDILGIKYPTARESSEESYNLVLFSDDCVKQMAPYANVYVCSDVKCTFEDINSTLPSITGEASLGSSRTESSSIEILKKNIIGHLSKIDNSKADKGSD